MIPTEDCAEVVPCVPEECRGCGAALSGTDPEPSRHQVCELPEITPIVTEYQCHPLVCDCGRSACGVVTVYGLRDSGEVVIVVFGMMPPPLPLEVFITLPPAVRAYIRCLETIVVQQARRIAQLETHVAVLTAHVAGLEAKLRQNSSDSHQPPSSDGPHVEPARETQRQETRRAARPPQART